MNIKSVVEQARDNAVVFRLFVELVILGIFVWTFCTVRDMPATYVTKAEARVQYSDLKLSTERQLDRIFVRIDDINNYIRGKGK